DHLEYVGGPDDRGGHLHAAGAPAVRHRHLARRERHLIAGNGDRLEDRAPDHPFCLFVQIGEVVGGDRVWMCVHSAASLRSAEATACSARMRRMRSSSAWKST